MPHPLSIALITIFCLALNARAEDKPSLAVKRVLDKAVAEVKKNRQEFDKANTKPLGEAKKALEDQAKKLIEDGKTDEATAILGQVKTLEADVMKMANAPAPVPVPAGGGRPVPQKPLLERMAGKWTNPNGGTIYEIQPNGAFREFFKSDGRLHREGQIRVLTDTAVEVLTQDGCRYKMSSAGADIIALEIWIPTGEPWSLGVVMTRMD